MKKTVLILMLLLISSQIFGLASYKQKDSSKEVFRVFAGLFIPINQWNNGDFDGESYFATEDGGILAIPELDTGTGWGVTCGWSFIYPGQYFNSIVKSSFNVSQSFHKGEFGGDPMDASLLMFTWYASGGIQLFDRITLLIGCGWDIPYFLFIKDGYIEGTERSDLTYWDLQGINGGIGLDIKITENFSLTTQGEYRLIDFGTGDYNEKSLPIEYIGTATWHGKLGIIYYPPMNGKDY